MTDTAPELSPLDLASLLCSRLCHDLLSPVGALSNGLELLADDHDPEMRQRYIDLLEQSARASSNKLKFFRLAFGSAGGFGENVSIEEPKELIEALVAGNAFAGDLATAATGAMEPAELTLIGIGVMGLVGIVVLIKQGSRAAGG